MRVWRTEAGDPKKGQFVDYKLEEDQGMVVLDMLHKIQAEAPGGQDLACRWNCKAGKCGSCSMEINGKPKLACMTRMGDYPKGETVQVQPLKAFPVIRDLVCDVSWNFRQKERIPHFKPGPRPADGDYRMKQEDVDRIQEFRKCIECFLCQDTCHVIRDHDRKDKFVGPRFMIHLAQLEMHPLDTLDRIPLIRNNFGSGMCNINKCCTEVCPEHIGITDNGIIPLKERVADRYYDPVQWVLRAVFGGTKREPVAENPPRQAPKFQKLGAAAK
jgi:succinate dehydrogenase / fumarate reductase iron-sulfur subunit